MQYYLDNILSEGHTTDACQKFIDIIERMKPAFNDNFDLALDAQGESVMEILLDYQCGFYAYLCDLIDDTTGKRFCSVQWAEHDRDLEHGIKRCGYTMVDYKCILQESDHLD